MQALPLNLSKRIFYLLSLVTVLSTAGGVWAQSENAIDPLKNFGLLLIEKEMIRVSEVAANVDIKTWQKGDRETYRALMLLENYFLNRGFTNRAYKTVHQMIKMRDVTQDLKKKSFLDCEAWRALDHDLKNYENKKLLEILKEKRKFTSSNHKRFRLYVSDKVSSCIKFVSRNWVWVGPDYKDQLLDVKAKNAVDSVKAYIVLKKKR